MDRTPRRATVLVLEADASLQKLLGAILPRAGFDPLFVPDGRSALQTLATGGIAAFLVDVSLAPSSLEEGTLRGVGFLRRLARDHPALLSRVVVISGLPWRRLAGDLPRVRHFVEKPFDITELLAAVSACLQPRAAAKARSVG